jgi:hypothetical protein
LYEHTFALDIVLKCNFTNQKFTNVCKNETRNAKFNNILSIYQSESFFLIIDSCMNVQQSKEKKKLSYTAFYLLFHELSNVELYPLLYCIYSGKEKSIRVPEQTLNVKYMHSFYIISVSVYIWNHGRTTFNPYCFRGYYRLKPRQFRMGFTSNCLRIL